MPFAEGRNARLYYEVHGSGEPLLLIPGFTATVEVYWANIEPLARRFRVIVFDPRGAGRSGLSRDGYTMRGFAGDCADVLDAAGAGRAHVLGTSFGGMIAQHFALEYPERTRRLVLGCTTPGGARHVLPPAENMATFLASTVVEDPVVGLRMRATLHYSEAWFATNEAALAERALATLHLRSPAEGREGQLAAVGGHDTWDALPAITAPALVAHGDEDGVVPVENGRNIASRIPGATLKIYEGARHVFFTERADEFNADVVAFLREDA